jgi:hypothetical protein
LDLEIKPIMDKESWINAKKAIGARLHQVPYWSNFGRWKKVLAVNKGKYMFCHNSAHNSDHISRNCPILKKLKKQTKSDNTNAALRVTAPSAGDSTKPALAPAPSSDIASGSGSLPGISQ